MLGFVTCNAASLPYNKFLNKNGFVNIVHFFEIDKKYQKKIPKLKNRSIYPLTNFFYL
jgi:hypothetical protein